MRTRILALIIVAVMIFPTSFAAFAANEAEVTKVMFTDADKATELTSLYDYSEGVGCSFSYQATAGTKAFGMLLLKKNGKIISSVEQTFSLAASGIASFDDIIEPDFTDVGVYEVVFMLFNSRENMQLIKGSGVKITCEIYPDEYDATYGLGFDFDDESSKAKMSYYRANGTNETKNIVISTDYAKHGNSSLGFPALKSYDRLMPVTTYSGGSIKDKLVELGNGKYRVSGYIYPSSEAVTFSPRINVKNSAINSGKEYNFIKKITAQPGKWSYFSADYDVEDYFSDTLATGRPQIQVEAALKAEQYIYIDDLKLIKLEENLEEMTPVVNAVVKAQVASEQKVVVTAEGEETIYAVEAVTADENGVAQAQLSLSDGFDLEDDVTINVYTDGKLSQKMSESMFIDDVAYVDFRYFTLSDIDGVKINGLTVNGEIMPYDEIVLNEGDVSVEFDIKNDKEKSLRIVAATYNNGMFISSAISKEGETEILIEGVSADDTIEFFLVDDKMTLTSHLYTLSQDGLTETEVYPSVAKFEKLPVARYNTVNACVEFDATVDEDSFAIFVAFPADKTEDDDYAYLGVKKLNEGSNHISLSIDNDRYIESGLFELDYYTTSADVSGSFAPYDYVGEKELLGYYETLNNPASAATDIYNAISAKALNIDMAQYNRLSSNSKAQAKVLELFVEYNDQKDIASAADIQIIFDEAVATVVLSCAATYDAIENLGDEIPLNNEFLADFKSEKIGFKEKVASLITANAVAPEDASKENANMLFEEAYLTAQLTYNTATYGAFMQMVTETYKDDINLDLSLIGKLNESDVFKYMYDNRDDVTNMEDVEVLYKKAIKALKDKKDDDDDKPSRVSSGGGGYSIPKQTQQVPPAPARTKFTDMEDSHWALESVLFLNGIGVVSDASAYRPNDSVTREESVKMLVCSFGDLDLDAQCSFADVDKTSWCYPYIASAYKTGMVNGINENTFGAGNNLSRQDALVMIYRIVKDNLDEVPDDYVFAFSDESSINDYALDAVKALCANGIVNGYTDGTFRPNVPISRAEFAKLLTTVFRR